MVRLGISTYLGVQDDIHVVDQAVNGKGVEKALALRPDAILMDLVMPRWMALRPPNDFKGVPEAKIIILTSFIDDEKVYPAIEAGAASYILKTSTAEEIANTIRKTAQGQSVLEPEVTNKMMNRLTHPAELVI